jgi:predicted TPR repeat methyltransferase
VLEIGCGPGALARELSPMVRHFLGLDFSPLAIRIATIMAPDNCDFFSFGEQESFHEFAESRDTMVCRDFFVHQNMESAASILQLARLLLKPGGIIIADFYSQKMVNAEAQKGEDVAPSTIFGWRQDQIQAICSDHGFETQAVNDDNRPHHNRRFVQMRKA